LTRSAPAPVPAPAQHIAPITQEVTAPPQPDPRQVVSFEGVFSVAAADNVQLTAPEFSFADNLRK